ncbi:MAG TPA: S49 family peptidase [Gammaproteobacteria bacterium]|nr:S49 family peptidase [Gammaproteobacteria bacterium]
MNEEKNEGWERDLVNKLAFSAISEQRKARRWGIFFKIAFLLYLITLPIIFISGEGVSSSLPVGEHTALVNLSGIITSDSDASADVVVAGLRDALENKNSKALIIRANSPGGSPVQADYMYNEILRLRKKYPNKPVYAVVTDVCASACYYIISATEKIYANKASIVGSIGVLSNGFGFVGSMKKLGIERRLYTAGKNKGALDPFSPEKPEDVAHMKDLMSDVHQIFIDSVKKGRGDRLKETPDMFSGLFWSGSKAKEMGLIDDFASSGKVARDIVGKKEIVDYTPRKNLLDKLVDRLGASIATNILPSNKLIIR